MGVRGLMSYCKRIQTPVEIHSNTLSLGIDAFSLIFLFREEREKFTEFLKSLNAHNMTFVMDKRAQKEKKETVDERKDIRSTSKAQVAEVSSFTQSET